MSDGPKKGPWLFHPEIGRFRWGETVEHAPVYDTVQTSPANNPVITGNIRGNVPTQRVTRPEGPPMNRLARRRAGALARKLKRSARP